MGRNCQECYMPGQLSSAMSCCYLDNLDQAFEADFGFQWNHTLVEVTSE